MNKISVSSGILLGAVVLILLFPSFAHYFEEKTIAETLNDWTQNGAVMTANGSASLFVNSTSSFSAISKNINVSAFKTLTLILSWVDSANLDSATYEVRILQMDRVIVSILKASDSEDWLMGNKTLQVSHSKTIELPAGQYVIIHSVRGSKGNVTISDIYVNLSASRYLARKVEAFAPFLIVLAIGAGVAASTSTISSLKKDVERLKTLLSLRR